MKKLFLVLTITFVYAFLRYNIFGNIPYKDIPLLIVNKAIAYSWIIWLLIGIKYFLKHEIEKYKNHISIFKKLLIAHILLSVIILGQDMLPKFLDNNTYTLFSNISLLAGTIAAASITLKGNKLQIILFLSLIKIHLFFMGFKGWITVEKWNGYMPPITLICFILLLVVDYIIISYKIKSKP